MPIRPLALLLLLLSCSGRSSDLRPPTLADRSGFTAQAGQPGPVPFVGSVLVHAPGLDSSGNIRVTVNPGEGSTAPAVTARYTYGALARRGAVGADAIAVPVHGLYAGAANAVTVEATFGDGSTASALVAIATASYAPAGWVYGKPAIDQSHDPSMPLGFGFYLIKSPRNPPVVMDIDGQVRWVGLAAPNSTSARFTDGGIVVGDSTAPLLRRLELDGSAAVIPLAAEGWTRFNHDIADGKSGLLVSVDVVRDGRTQVQSVLAEVDASGAVLREWSMGDSIARAMRAGGDDPSKFVRDGVDWFHLNSAFYDAASDSLIVSSRENFVARIDYQSGDLIWVFGDPAKYWATFPSLAQKSLSLADGGLWPIGQHEVTMTPERQLLLFNDGTPSVSQPPGAPVGASLPASSVCTYSIDEDARLATQVSRFDHEPALYSAFCSSAYQANDGSLLVDYAMAGGKEAVLVGLDSTQRTAFQLRLPTSGCNTAWNAEPIAFDDLSFE